MKGKICDGDKGLLFFSIIFAVFGIISMIIGFIELPFFPVGVAMIVLAILIIIPHEYIDDNPLHAFAMCLKKQNLRDKK